MNPQAHARIPQAFAGVKSHTQSEDPARVAVPGGFLDPRSLSALAAHLDVDGRFWATVQLPARSPLMALAHALSTESYRQSWQLQDDTIALAAATYSKEPDMITVGHQYRYLAWQGKLRDRCNQIVTVLRCQGHEILVRFPDGHQARTQRRFLRKVAKPR
ncbi:hypothetical protein ES705_51018 [subsurface metagenome]